VRPATCGGSRALGVGGQRFGCGRSRVFAWQVWGLDVAGQGLRVWQVKGLGMAGQGQALTFPSNMASEEPGRETGQPYKYVASPSVKKKFVS